MKRLLVLLALVIPGVVFSQVIETNDALFLKSPSNKTLEIEPGGTGELRINLIGTTARLPISNPAAGTAATTVATGGTVDTTLFWQRIINAGAASTGVILEAGVNHGQLVLVSADKDSFGSFTMAAEATSNVCSGTAGVLAIGGGALFIWDATDTCWAEVVN